MIKVELFDQNGRISGFSVSGHSGYAEAGSVRFRHDRR